MTITLKTAIKNTTQLTAEQVINGRFYHSKKGWVSLTLTDKETALQMIADCLGGRKRAKIESVLNWGKPQHWGLRRIFFKIYEDKIYCSYCAGQDYPGELNQIRKYLYNL